MPVSMVSIMIGHTYGCSSPVSIEKERFQGGTEPPRVLCIHALRPRAGGALHEQSISERQSLSRRADRVRLHDSALPLRIFFKSERGYCIDTDSQGKVLEPVKEIERGPGRDSRPRLKR